MAKSKLDLVVLGFMNLKPVYGYEVAQLFQKPIMHMIGGVKMPSIYKALHRLEGKGFISGEKKVEGNNPPKTIYNLTPEGKKYFRKLLKEILLSDNPLPMDFWMAVRFMYKSITRDFFIKVLDKREAIYQNMNALHQKHMEEKEEEFGELPFYVYVMKSEGKKHQQIELNTIKRLREEAIKPENQQAFLQEDEE